MDPTLGIVQLRDVQSQDFARLYEFQRDPESNRMAATLPRLEDEFHDHWKNISSDPHTVAKAVTLDDVLVGTINCFKMEDIDAIGYWIGRKFWGQGIASRALTLLLAEVEIRPLHAHVAIANKASLRVLQKNGFKITDVRAAPAKGRFLECEEATLVLS